MYTGLYNYAKDISDNIQLYSAIIELCVSQLL